MENQNIRNVFLSFNVLIYKKLVCLLLERVCVCVHKCTNCVVFHITIREEINSVTSVSQDYDIVIKISPLPHLSSFFTLVVDFIIRFVNF